MNKRNALIIAPIAVVAIAIAAYSYLGSKHSTESSVSATGSNANHNGYPNLDEVRSRVKARLDQLNAMTPAQWDDEKKKNPRITVTLDQVRENAKKSLDRLNSMTEEQWDEQRRQAIARQQQAAAAHQASTAPAQSASPVKPGTAKPADSYYPPAATR